MGKVKIELDLMNDNMSRSRYKKLKGLGFLQRHKRFKRAPALYRIGVCMSCGVRGIECVCNNPLKHG